eukprot:9469782-Pyramimonas_sp.AAC.1
MFIRTAPSWVFELIRGGHYLAAVVAQCFEVRRSEALTFFGQSVEERESKRGIDLARAVYIEAFKEEFGCHPLHGILYSGFNTGIRWLARSKSIEECKGLEEQIAAVDKLRKVSNMGWVMQSMFVECCEYHIRGHTRRAAEYNHTY